MARIRFGTFLAPHHPVGEAPTLQFQRDLGLVERIELIRPRTAAAVRHTGHHEHSQPVVLSRSHLSEDTGVVIKRVERRDRTTGSAVVPAVIDQELSAA